MERGRERGKHVHKGLCACAHFFDDGGSERLSLLASFFLPFLKYNIAIHSQSESGKEENVQERERV